jgi:hypothetical protein
MQSPGPGGFLGLGNTLRSLTMSPVASALDQAHRMARRHLEAGGAAGPASGKAKPTTPAAEEFDLPEDVDADEVLAAIHAKLGGAGKPRRHDEPDVLERKAGGRIAVSGYHILRLGDGRYDLGKRYIQRIVSDIRARRIQLRTKALMRRR